MRVQFGADTLIREHTSPSSPGKLRPACANLETSPERFMHAGAADEHNRLMRHVTGSAGRASTAGDQADGSPG